MTATKPKRRYQLHWRFASGHTGVLVYDGRKGRLQCELAVGKWQHFGWCTADEAAHVLDDMDAFGQAVRRGRELAAAVAKLFGAYL